MKRSSLRKKKSFKEGLEDVVLALLGIFIGLPLLISAAIALFGEGAILPTFFGGVVLLASLLTWREDAREKAAARLPPPQPLQSLQSHQPHQPPQPPQSLPAVFNAKPQAPVQPMPWRGEAPHALDDDAPSRTSPLLRVFHKHLDITGGLTRDRASHLDAGDLDTPSWRDPYFGLLAFATVRAGGDAVTFEVCAHRNLPDGPRFESRRSLALGDAAQPPLPPQGVSIGDDAFDAAFNLHTLCDDTRALLPPRARAALLALARLAEVRFSLGILTARRDLSFDDPPSVASTILERLREAVTAMTTPAAARRWPEAPNLDALTDSLLRADTPAPRALDILATLRGIAPGPRWHDLTNRLFAQAIAGAGFDPALYRALVLAVAARPTLSALDHLTALSDATHARAALNHDDLAFAIRSQPFSDRARDLILRGKLALDHRGALSLVEPPSEHQGALSLSEPP